MAIERIRTYCALCISRCGCIAVVEDGRLAGIEPDPDHPTGRSLCVKGRAAAELASHPQRLTQPLRRTGRKGADPGWQALSWEAALDFAAERLQRIAREHGPEAVAFSVTTPSGTAVADGMGWLLRLANAFGSPNLLFTTHVCNWHRDHATRLTTGADIGMPDFAQASCLFLWGFNPSATWPAFGERVAAARRRGMKLVVVDPRRAGLAGKADVWLPVRPGTDGALALALAGMLIDAGHFDAAFVARYSNGPFLVREDNGAVLRRAGEPLVWDDAAGAPVAAGQAQSPALRGRFDVDGTACRPAFELYAALCREMPPERAAALTGVPVDRLRQAAALLGEQAPVAYYAWAGVNQGSNVTQTSRALAILFALTGGFDAPGGNRQWPKPALANVTGRELLAPGQRAKTLGLSERPLGPAAAGFVTEPDLYRAMRTGKPYAVRGLVSFGANLLTTRPDPASGRAALNGLDFHLHADLFRNETASYADLLLPVASAWERSGLCAGFQLDRQASARLQLRPAVAPPLGEARSDAWIAFELAKRLGLARHFFAGDMAAGLAHELEPSGLSADDLRASPGGIELPLAEDPLAYRRQGFATPSGRLEIYSETLLAQRQPPLPAYLPPPATPDGAYPLTLTSAKAVPYCHSQFRAIESLRRRQPEARVEVHPATAAAAGIGDGEIVELLSPNGRVRVRARLSAAIAEGFVCLDYGWEGESNYAMLVGLDVMDPVSGSLPLRGGACSLHRCSGTSAGHEQESPPQPPAD